MADDETPQKADGSASPSSQHGLQSGGKASKDRECPFCGQAFTSSSLGRHLDLYIKPKNPKPSDGIHDVVAIRKIRGGITRRQPRASMAKRLDDNDDSRRNSSELGTPGPASAGERLPRSVDARFAEDSPAQSPIHAREGERSNYPINTANWQATGVMNDIPPRVPSRTNVATPTGQAQRIQDMRKDTSTGSRVQRPEYESDSMWKLQQDAEVGRAAELALREVLSSLEAASKKIESKLLFDDIDFLSLSFPGLCLAILPAPSTLFSPTPFATADSWTLSPPGQRQFEAINRMVNEQVAAKRNGVRENFKDSLVFKHSAHVQGAWEHWQCMAESDKASAWQLELCRAYANGTEQKRAMRGELEAAKNRINHLEAEYDRLSRCQLPREYLMHPPHTVPAPAAIMREMKAAQHKTEAAEAHYDIDTLLSKWRTTAKATARRPAAAAYTTNASIYDESAKGQENYLRNDIVMNGSIYGVGGPMPRDSLFPATAASGGGAIEYETPPKPGAIDEMDDDADADAEEDDSARSAADQSALVRNRNYRTDSPAIEGTINANGKRPPFALNPTPANGRGPKMYKAQHEYYADHSR